MPLVDRDFERKRLCVLKNSVCEAVLTLAGYLVFNSHSFIRFLCGCDLRNWLTVEEPHQPFQVLHRCCEVELFAYEPHAAQSQTA